MQQKDQIIVTAGTYNPLTLIDLNFLKQCKKKGNWLAVGIHTDKYILQNLSQNQIIQSYSTRVEILKSLKFVDEVFRFDDTDGTVCQLLKIVKICYENSNITYISQRDMFNSPETRIRGINFEIIK
jgi:cytidyltransferase-like protein